MFFSTRANVRRAQAVRVYDHQDVFTRQEERRLWMTYAARKWHASLVGETRVQTFASLILHCVLLVITCAAIFGTVSGVIGVFDWMASK